ncbi:MAG: glutaminyl-peptide cyclotransferase [Thermodesulfobacteriota bacterium]
MMKRPKSEQGIYRKIFNLIFLEAVLLIIFLEEGISAGPLFPPVDAVVYGYRIIQTYPHDPKAFTQGLIYRDGFLFESTGINGKSTLRKVRLTTGEVVLQHHLPKKYFGEGLTEFEDRLIQLTWKSNLAFVYDRISFKLVKAFSFEGEGWGLTQDGNRLIMSDGSAELRILDPKTFKELHRISVLHGKTPISDLNELEFVKGEIFANRWQTDQILRIDSNSGKINGWIDLKGLLPKKGQDASAGVLNGIAYDEVSDRLFVTGKFWPKVFEISLHRRP